MDQNVDQIKRQQSEELVTAFSEIFPLASRWDLPRTAADIKGFLGERIEREIADGVFNFQSRIAKILCEVTLPKTTIEAMCRMVVEEVKRARENRDKLDRAIYTAVERDEMQERIREIGKLVGCNHTEDPDGRQKLVRCVGEIIPRERSVHHSWCIAVTKLCKVIGVDADSIDWSALGATAEGINDTLEKLIAQLPAGRSKVRHG